MKWILLIIVVAVGLLVAVVLLGSLLPDTYAVARSATYKRSPEVVFALLSDVERLPSWRPDVYKVERLPAGGDDADGKRHPAYRAISKRGAVTLAVTEIQVPTRLSLQALASELPFGDTWTYALAETESGTRVTITERGSIKNPLTRFVARFLLRDEALIESQLRALGR